MTDLFKTVSHLAALGLVTLHNARGEFACNSSSSHSIVVLPAGFDAGGYEADGEYGWDTFTLTSSTAKIRYLAAMLNGRVSTKAIARELREGLGEGNWSEHDYVNHQSVLDFPMGRFGTGSEEFVRTLATLLAHPRVAVLGGNDNDGHHPLEEAPGVEALPLPTYGSWVMRRDTQTVEGTEHAWWSMFSRADGTKLRLGLDLLDGGFEPTKSPTPELVDVKLTNRCAFELDCDFCYMASTRDGAEGDPLLVMNLVAALAELEVFEIAFGGGEPTLWPHFDALLEFCHSVGVVPNFTTKNYQGLGRNPQWLKNAGAIALSVISGSMIPKIDKALSGLHSWELSRKLTIQVIPELLSDEDLTKVLDWATTKGYRVTFLGYKTTGRGLAFGLRNVRPKGFWIPLAAKYDPDDLRLAIDTVLAEQCQDELAAAGVPQWCYHTKEGAFSLYVDAVTGRMGPSSYCDDALMDEVDLADSAALAEAVKTRYQAY